MKKDCVTVTQNWVNSSTGKLKDVCGSSHMEIGGEIHQEERKYGSESLQHLR